MPNHTPLCPRAIRLFARLGRALAAALLGLSTLAAPLLPAARSAHAQSTTIWYVDMHAAGANTGQAWTDAFRDLQAALAAAGAGDQIWVAEGVYTPGVFREDAFELRENVAIYGGFAGGETGLAQRDPAARPTILSGDLNGDDIVSGRTPAVIGDTLDDGIDFNDENSYHVVVAADNAVLDSVTIEGGNANTMYVDPPIHRYYGGGLYALGVDGLTLRNIVFRHNFAHFGGGVFAGNKWEGGTLIEGSLTVENAAFIGNVGVCGGGVTFDYHALATVTNATFHGNASVAEGGALCLSDNRQALKSVTISGNYAAEGGSGIAVVSDGLPTIENSIVWGNGGSGQEIGGSKAGSAAVTDSIVQGGWPGVGNLDVDPRLGSLGDHGGPVPTMPLLSGSPAIDAASQGCPAADARGYPRSSPSCDLGAYESHPIYVDARSAGANTGASWADAFTHLQDALAIATPGQEVWVAEGTYYPADDRDPGATFELPAGVVVYGGFMGGEVLLRQRDLERSETTLSCDYAGDDIYTDGYADNIHENCLHVLVAASGARLDGFTVTGGAADDGYPDERRGGGIYIQNAAGVTLANLRFIHNFGREGGGVFAESSPGLTLENVEFIGNLSESEGGGMLSMDTDFTMTGARFEANRAGEGGGLYIHQGEPALTNVLFSANHADDGGGLYIRQSEAALHNAVFIVNQADGFGAGLYVAGTPTEVTLTNATFHGNLAALSGGAIFTRQDIWLINSILWEDAPDEIDDRYYVDAADSLIMGGGAYWDVDPQFVAPFTAPGVSAGVDVRLRSSSPVIDQGNDFWVAAETDRLGRPRRFGPVDLGAYEWYPIFVDERANGNGRSWEQAFRSLGRALQASRPYDQIWVAEGVYTPGVARADAFELRENVGIYGGFAGGEMSLSQRNPAAHPTILSGDLNGDDVISGRTPSMVEDVIDDGIDHNDENSYHVLVGADNAVLDGVTIQGGNANNHPDEEYYGGGVVSHGADGLVLRNIFFRHNYAEFGGGLLAAGVLNGGEWDLGSLTVENVAFTGNVSTCGGGAMFAVGVQAALSNATFLGNTSVTEGGAMCISVTSPSLRFVTISGNHAAEGAAGIAVVEAGRPTLENSILWGNGGAGKELSVNGDGAITVANSLVQGGWSGAGNFDADPLLAPFGDYGGSVPTLPLLPGSPALNAAVSSCPASDARGLPRSSPACDLGAFESQGFALAYSAGDGQQAVIGAPFAQPLAARVTALNPAEPVDGGIVTFTAPAIGPSAVLDGGPAAIHNGLASVTAVANEQTGGPYAVMAALPTGESAAFHLNNLWFKFIVFLTCVRR